MTRLRFEQLLSLYRSIDFDAQGDEGLLTLSTPEQIANLLFIEADEIAAEDANLAVITDPATIAVGKAVRVRVGQPRIGLGILARTFENLLKASEARITEPNAYYIVDSRLDTYTVPPSATLAAYRKVLDLVALFAKAAAYLDRTRQELVFIHDGKVVVPVRYDVKALEQVSIVAIDTLLENFKDDVHQDQKLAILEASIVQMVEAVPTAQRFTYLLENLGAVTETLRQGYRLFASSFSYSKIRGEVEAARVDYVAKIHKTLIDIQGQLLGIPIATIITVSQLKAVQGCGVEFWTNIAVLAGAWVFVVLLIIAIANQWITLEAIDDDIKAQQKRLESDYAAISEQFVSIFTGLIKRVSWHRGALIVIAGIAVIGAVFASYAFVKLTPVSSSCLTKTPVGAVLPAKSAVQTPALKAIAVQPPAPKPAPAVKGIKGP
ncbi:MAG: hypothetical protein P4L64_03415 [Caulobacteraceae bacterium]|nr:hypothetical protein [Caulobacteraceae bacterium]